MNITDITNAALLELHRRSIEECAIAFDPGVPDWARDLRIARHDEVIREMIRRGLLAPTLSAANPRENGAGLVR